jgi:hypothetical protein
LTSYCNTQVAVSFGGLVYAVSTFVNSPILISVGAVFLTVGLVLYTCDLAWYLNDIMKDYHIDHPMKFKHRNQNRAILVVIAMITTLVGIFFLVKKAVDLIIRPYFGPANYNLYGSLSFGAGAFTFMLLK